MLLLIPDTYLRHIFLTTLNIYKVVINIPNRGTMIRRYCPFKIILFIIRNSAIKPLVKGNPILAKAQKIKI